MNILKASTLFTFIFSIVSFSNIFAQSASRSAFILKDKPFLKVNYQWDRNDDLDILMTMNMERDLLGKDSSRFFDANKLVVNSISGDIIWIDPNGADRTTSIVSNEILKLREGGNTWRGKIFVESEIGEKLRHSDNWKSCFFTINYAIDGASHESAKFPLYFSKSTNMYNTF